MGFHTHLLPTSTVKKYNRSYLEDWLSTWHQINKGSFDQQFAAYAIVQYWSTEKNMAICTLI